MDELRDPDFRNHIFTLCLRMVRHAKTLCDCSDRYRDFPVLSDNTNQDDAADTVLADSPDGAFKVRAGETSGCSLPAHSYAARSHIPCHPTGWLDGNIRAYKL